MGVKKKKSTCLWRKHSAEGYIVRMVLPCGTVSYKGPTSDVAAIHRQIQATDDHYDHPSGVSKRKLTATLFQTRFLRQQAAWDEAEPCEPQ